MMAGVRVYVLVLSCAACIGWAGCSSVSTRVAKTAASLYTRHDSDHTEIWSPRANVAVNIDERAEVSAGYTMDAWTSASIDIRTSATKAIHELRHEFEAGTSYVLDDLTLSGGYRYSTENDYWSHGGVLGAALDLAQRNTTLALNVFGAHDTVGRFGDALFRYPLDSLGGRFTWTQVLGEQSLAQLSWETTFLTGFQESPYRWVAVGGNGTCAALSPYCLPENVPDQRCRHALGGRYRFAVGERWSFGVGYRFYFDSWGVMSHTIEPEAVVNLSKNDELSADYRYYTQNDADFYRARYRNRADGGGLLTRDRKLSAFYSHAVGLSYTHREPLGGDGVVLVVSARASGTLYEYLAYVGLQQVRALELTGALSLEVP